MASRAYFLINLDKNFELENLKEKINKLEESMEVDFADPVIGDYDLVLMVETEAVEQSAREVEALDWVGELKILRVLSADFKRTVSKEEILNLIANGG